MWPSRDESDPSAGHAAYYDWTLVRRSPSPEGRGGQGVRTALRKGSAFRNGCRGTPPNKDRRTASNLCSDRVLAEPPRGHDACTCAPHPTLWRVSVKRMRAVSVAGAIVGFLS